MIFDGKAFAKEVEQGITEKVKTLGSKPWIVSVLVGEDPASVLYTRLKKEAAARVGIEYEVYQTNTKDVAEIKKEIEGIAKRDEVTGIMVQMPIPGLSRVEQERVLECIPLAKDVDGLRWEESGIMPATVKAIISILEKIATESKCDIYRMQFVIVGSHGSVGKPLVHFLGKKGVRTILEVNSKTEGRDEVIEKGEVVISCVGHAGLIKTVKPQAIAVDVGISRVENKTVGDMTTDVYNAASVAVPVPGGVGPVTVACLMENAVKIA